MPAVTVPNRNRRLGSLRNSALGPKAKSAQRPAQRKHTCCDNPKVEDDGEGHMVCRNCFTQISESNIVADVTFQEDSRGAATVQGDFIGEHARHAQTLGRGVSQRVGGGEKNTALEIERNGKRALAGLCPRLDIPESISNQANSLYIVAAQNNFSAGRRTDEVVAACLYAACRRQKDNKIMLIDISELLHLNVFRLGEVYKDLCRELYLKSTGVGTQYLVEVESLIMKYCRQLQFEDQTRQVAEDAVKIVRRMKRDWMVTGRHPAGLCGACIILAARMNNFRRSIREVVFVAKVSDATMLKRVHEFRRTKSASLTVDQFREFAPRLKHQHDPPVLYESDLKKQKFEEKKRKRKEASEAREVIEISDDDAESSSSSRESSAPANTPSTQQQGGEPSKKRRRSEKTQSATPAATQQEPRRDADGFLIPPLPVDPNLQQEREEKPKRGRGRPKIAAQEPVVITEEELADEAQLAGEIDHALNDEEIIDSRNEIEKVKSEERAKMLAEQQKQKAAESVKARRESEGITWLNGTVPSTNDEVTPESLEEEFSNDPEVQNCLLSEAEQVSKEQIWVHNNLDWLRLQQEKKMVEAVVKATGRNAQGKKPGKGAKRTKRRKIGDGTTLAEATTPIETPADATAAMLAKRAPGGFSKYINYSAMQALFQHSPSTSTSASRRGSTTTSPNDASRDQTPSTAARDAAQERESTSLTPAPRSEAPRLQSPPTTQQAGAAAHASVTPARRTQTTAPQAPSTPPQTQAEAGAGAEDEESEGEEGDYVQDELDYGSDAGSSRGSEEADDREDIGEDDYHGSIDPTGGWSVTGTYGEEDY